jgi:hypothetical protein
MFDISDFYVDKNEKLDKFKSLKINNKKFQEDREEGIELPPDVRS